MLYEWNYSEPVSCAMFGRMVQNNGWQRKNSRKNADHLLVFVISGTADFFVEDVSVSLCTGDVLLIPAGMMYHANTVDQCEYYFFRFTAQLRSLSQAPTYPVFDRSGSFLIPKVSQKSIALADKTQLQEDYQKFYQCIISCMECNSSMTLSGRLALDVELQKILLLLSQNLERKSNSALPLLLRKMMEYVQVNLTKPITSSELCAYCGVSPSYAARLFRKYLKTTISRYIIGEKLYHDSELMQNTGMNISQIAAYLGFCDVYYFSKCFKEKFGKSPTQMFPRT